MARDTSAPGDPSTMTDGKMFQMVASVLEEHAERIFVYAKDGRRLIADLRRRANGEAPPVREDIEDFRAVSNTGEVVVSVPSPRHRSEEIVDATYWLPPPIPGRMNLRLSSVDDTGMIADMELGNASVETTKAAISMLMEEHASDQRRRKGKVA
jgi:hypothetical protein